jgi:predicted secreted protein
VTIIAQNKPVGEFKHSWYSDYCDPAFGCIRQIFILQLNQDNTYILTEHIESDALEEPIKIVGSYTYNKNILTLQTPTIRVFKVNRKMTKLKAIEKTKAYGKKFREIYNKS